MTYKEAVMKQNDSLREIAEGGSLDEHPNIE